MSKVTEERGSSEERALFTFSSSFYFTVYANSVAVRVVGDGKILLDIVTVIRDLFLCLCETLSHEVERLHRAYWERQVVLSDFVRV